MTSNLATKQDLHHLDLMMVTRLDAFESRMSLMIENFESRLLIKLGALITVQCSMGGAAVALLR